MGIGTAYRGECKLTGDLWQSPQWGDMSTSVGISDLRSSLLDTNSLFSLSVLVIFIRFVAEELLLKFLNIGILLGKDLSKATDPSMKWHLAMQHINCIQFMFSPGVVFF